MFKIGKTETVPLTPALAKLFAEMRAAPGERSLKPGRVSYLEQRIRQGQFYSPKWARALFHGTAYRVNGQHSSVALLNVNGEFPSGLDAVIDNFTCDSLEDLAELFAQYDNSKSARNSTEIVNAHGKTHIELRDVSERTMRDSVAAIAFSVKEEEKTIFQAEERARLIHSNIDFVLWFDAFISKRPMRRVGNAAAMYVTYKKSIERASEFWNHVRDESHPDNKNPSRVYARFLADSQASTTSNTKKPMFSTRAFMAKGIHAWNAYWGGYATDLKYHSNSPIPKIK